MREIHDADCGCDVSTVDTACPHDETAEPVSMPAVPEKSVPRWRPAEEPTCCGSGCLDCPF